MEYQVSESMLKDLGIEKGSMTLIDQQKRSELQAHLGDNVHLCNGGSAANSLFVSKQLGLNVHHLGIIGSDHLSQFVIEDYQANAIHQSFDQTKIEGETGCCLVLITPDGERTMLTYLGVSNQFKSVDALLPVIADAKQLFIEGYLVADDHCYDLICNHIIPTAKTHHTEIAFTLSDAGLISFFHDRFNAIVQMQLDIIFCNFQEACTLSTSNNIQDIQLFFAPLAKETIVTDGKNGAHIIHASGVTHCPTNPLQPIDTTGAGDAFAGTYLAQKLQAMPIEMAAKKANEISSVVISNFGARPLALVKHLLSN
jgi:sugar/nucleoside kinase (ribokinase family)